MSSVQAVTVGSVTLQHLFSKGAFFQEKNYIYAIPLKEMEN